MKGFIIAALNDDGNYKGYYNGVNFDSPQLDKANFIQDKTQARAALGNLQRTNANQDLTIVPVEMTISILNQSTEM